MSSKWLDASTATTAEELGEAYRALRQAHLLLLEQLDASLTRGALLQQDLRSRDLDALPIDLADDDGRAFFTSGHDALADQLDAERALIANDAAMQRQLQLQAENEHLETKVEQLATIAADKDRKIADMERLLADMNKKLGELVKDNDAKTLSLSKEKEDKARILTELDESKARYEADILTDKENRKVAVVDLENEQRLKGEVEEEKGKRILAEEMIAKLEQKMIGEAHERRSLEERLEGAKAALEEERIKQQEELDHESLTLVEQPAMIITGVSVEQPVAPIAVAPTSPTLSDLQYSLNLSRQECKRLSSQISLLEDSISDWRHKANVERNLVTLLRTNIGELEATVEDLKRMLVLQRNEQNTPIKQSARSGTQNSGQRQGRRLEPNHILRELEIENNLAEIQPRNTQAVRR